MTAFDTAFNYVVANEGGGKYTDNPLDKGGPTRWGVSLKTLAAFRGKACTSNDVQLLTQTEAALVYKRLYWDVMRCADIKDASFATAIFDSSVLFGPARAGKAVQQAINKDCALAPLKLDGRVGDATLAALNAQPRKGMLLAYVNELVGAIVDIVGADRTQTVFFAGWVRRVGCYLGLIYAPTTSTQAAS